VGVELGTSGGRRRRRPDRKRTSGPLARNYDQSRRRGRL